MLFQVSHQTGEFSLCQAHLGDPAQLRFDDNHEPNRLYLLDQGAFRRPDLYLSRVALFERFGLFQNFVLEVLDEIVVDLAGRAKILNNLRRDAFEGICFPNYPFLVATSNQEETNYDNKDHLHDLSFLLISQLSMSVGVNIHNLNLCVYYIILLIKKQV